MIVYSCGSPAGIIFGENSSRHSMDGGGRQNAREMREPGCVLLPALVQPDSFDCREAWVGENAASLGIPIAPATLKKYFTPHVLEKNAHPLSKTVKETAFSTRSNSATAGADGWMRRAEPARRSCGYPVATNYAHACRAPPRASRTARESLNRPVCAGRR